MQTRFQSASSFFLAIGLVLPLVGATSAQETETRSKRTERFTGYVSRLLGSSEMELSPPAMEVHSQLYGLLNKECSEVAAADSAGLEREEEWLRGLLADRRRALATARAALEDDILTGQYTGAWKTREGNLEFELAVLGLVHEVVGVCIEDRREQLAGPAAEGVDEMAAEEEESGEAKLGIYKEVYRTWTATCEAPDRIDPPVRGILTLLLPGDGTVHGLLAPSDSNVGLEYAYLEPAKLKSDGSFRLATPAGATKQVEVLAPSDRDPPAASGTIRLSGEVEGYGAWSCTGTWRDQ